MSTFPCPQCKTAYRLSPAHLGRKVRCKVCQTVFILGQQAAESALDSSGLFESAASIAKTRMQSVTKLIDKQQTNPNRSRHGAIDSMARNKLRSVMARKLNSLQDAALSAIPADQRPGSEPHLGPRKKGDFTVVKAGAPDRSTANRLLLGMFAGLILAVALLSWQILGVGTGRAAAAAFSAAHNDLGYPQRHLAHLEEAWAPLIGDRQILIALDSQDAHFEAVQRFDGRELATTLGSLLDGHVYLPVADVWVPVTAAQSHPPIMAMSDPDALRTTLTDNKIPNIDRLAIDRHLSGLGIAGDKRLVVMAMLFGRLVDGRPSDAAKRLLRRDWPTTWYYQRFRNDSGSLLTIDGQRYQQEQGRSYEGLIVYCAGDRWGDRWRILDIAESLALP